MGLTWVDTFNVCLKRPFHLNKYNKTLSLTQAYLKLSLQRLDKPCKLYVTKIYIIKYKLYITLDNNLSLIISQVKHVCFSNIFVTLGH